MTFFDSLIDSQITRLASSTASLQKIAEVGSKKNETSYRPDKERWENELNIFRQLSAFEKPAYQHEYVVKNNINDPKSNLLIRSYHSSSRILVPELRFYYYQDTHHLKKIEAVYQENNSLFTTRRNLALDSTLMRVNPKSVNTKSKEVRRWLAVTAFIFLSNPAFIIKRILILYGKRYCYGRKREEEIE